MYSNGAQFCESSENICLLSVGLSFGCSGQQAAFARECRNLSIKIGQHTQATLARLVPWHIPHGDVRGK